IKSFSGSETPSIMKVPGIIPGLVSLSVIGKIDTTVLANFIWFPLSNYHTLRTFQEKLQKLPDHEFFRLDMDFYSHNNQLCISYNSLIFDEYPRQFQFP